MCACVSRLRIFSENSTHFMWIDQRAFAVGTQITDNDDKRHYRRFMANSWAEWSHLYDGVNSFRFQIDWTTDKYLPSLRCHTFYSVSSRPIKLDILLCSFSPLPAIHPNRNLLWRPTHVVSIDCFSNCLLSTCVSPSLHHVARLNKVGEVYCITLDSSLSTQTPCKEIKRNEMKLDSFDGLTCCCWWYIHVAVHTCRHMHTHTHTNTHWHMPISFIHMAAQTNSLHMGTLDVCDWCITMFRQGLPCVAHTLSSHQLTPTIRWQNKEIDLYEYSSSPYTTQLLSFALAVFIYSMWLMSSSALVWLLDRYSDDNDDDDDVVWA